MTEQKKDRRPKLDRSKFFDPLDTSQQWKLPSVKDIFGTKADVFGKKRTAKIEKAEEEEPEEVQEAEGEEEGEEES